MLRRTPVLIALCAFFCIAGAVGGYLYYFFATPIYRAQIVVAPPMDSGDSQNVRVNLDFLRGLSGGAGGTSEVHNQFLFQLTSYDTASRLFAHPAIIKVLRERRIGHESTADGIQGYLTKAVHLNQPRSGLLEKSPFTIIAIKDRDPAFASLLLKVLVEESDNLIRRRRIGELAAQKGEVMRTLSTVTTAEYREALVRLLAQVERERLFANVNKYYAYRIVDPRMHTSTPIEPTLILSVGIGFFIGLLIVVMIIVIVMLKITVFPKSND